MTSWKVYQLDNDPTIVVIEGEESDWELYHQHMEEAFEVSLTIDNRVDFILLTHGPLPSNHPMPHFRRTLNTWRKHENVASLIVVLQMSFFAEKIATILLKLLLPSKVGKVIYVKTLEDAVTEIKQLREKETLSSSV